MNEKISKYFIIFFSTLTFCLSIESLSAGKQKVFYVKNVAGLIKNIGPDRKIIMRKGTYRLNKATGIVNPHISWRNKYNLELTIHFVSNLIIKGENGTRILNVPRSGHVLSLNDCRNVTIKNLIMGHSPKRYCYGGVVHLLKCQNIQITNCTLFGSGTVGIFAAKSKKITISNSTIKQCTYRNFEFISTDNIIFNRCRFLNTRGGNHAVFTSNNSTITIKESLIYGNGSKNLPSLFYAQGNRTKIKITSSNFSKNRGKFFSNSPGKFYLSGNRFENNNFKAPQQ